MNITLEAFSLCWSELAALLTNVPALPQGIHTPCTGLCSDSRDLQQDNIFFCLSGEHVDGHSFALQVLSGAVSASLVVADHSKAPELLQQLNCPNIQTLQAQYPILLVDNVNQSMALMAKSLCLHQLSKQELSLPRLIGVTGTNGKTSTVHFIGQSLSLALSGKSPVGVLGTLGSKVFADGKEIEFLGEGSGRTTALSIELWHNIQILAEKRCQYIATEVSSHALVQQRVYGCAFEIAIFTNLTQDHLDYHLTMERYFEAKAMLFDMLGSPSSSKAAAIINADDPSANKLLDYIQNIQRNKPSLDLEIITFGQQQSGTRLSHSATLHLQATNTSISKQGLRSQISIQEQYNATPIVEEIQLSLWGDFNLSNALASLASCLALDIPPAQAVQYTSLLQAAAGRFQIAPKPVSIQNKVVTAIVDYAHTPDGLEQVLKTAKQILSHSDIPHAKLACLFGCGGDRDTSKRPVMGQIAAQYADRIFLTSDNPRSEDPNQIMADILAGITNLKNVTVEIDRSKAISLAVQNLGPDDLLLVAGKGHETYQILATETIHLDDLEEIQKAYEQLANQL